MLVVNIHSKKLEYSASTLNFWKLRMDRVWCRMEDYSLSRRSFQLCQVCGNQFTCRCSILEEVYLNRFRRNPSAIPCSSRHLYILLLDSYRMAISPSFRRSPTGLKKHHFLRKCDLTHPPFECFRAIGTLYYFYSPLQERSEVTWEVSNSSSFGLVLPLHQRTFSFPSFHCFNIARS